MPVSVNSETSNTQNAIDAIPTYQPNDFIIRIGDGASAVWMQVRALDEEPSDDPEGEVSMVPAENPADAKVYGLYQYIPEHDRWYMMTESALVGQVISTAFMARPTNDIKIVNLPDYLNGSI